MSQLWREVSKQCPSLGRNVVKVLLPFGLTCLYERPFCAMAEHFIRTVRTLLARINKSVSSKQVNKLLSVTDTDDHENLLIILMFDEHIKVLCN